MAAELTVEISRKHRVDSPAVYMSGFSVMVIRFRVHMEQGDCEHPHNDPDSQTGSQCVACHHRKERVMHRFIYLA